MDNKVMNELNARKVVKLEINDILFELFAENNRLLNELKFTENVIKVLENQRNYLINKCFNECVNCVQNVTISTQLSQFDTTLRHLKTNHNNQSIQTNGRQSEEKTTQELNEN